MPIKIFGRPWKILNYVVHEPDEWTTRQITEDLDEVLPAMVNTVIKLKRLGYVKPGRTVGKSKTLVPTDAGVKALEEAVKWQSVHM
jgi:hypothetical protein